jgi:hypothetical protein
MYLILAFSCSVGFSYLWTEISHEGKAVDEKHVGGIFLMIFAPYKVNILMCGGDLSIFTLHYKLFTKKTIFTQFVTIAHHIEMNLVLFSYKYKLNSPEVSKSSLMLSLLD